jgi:hypothetical protein
MKRIKFVKYVWIAFVLLVVFSCKEDNPDDKGNNFETLSFSETEVMERLPDALETSNDPMAQMVVGWVSLATNWGLFVHAIEPPENASPVAGNNSYSWGWNYLGNSFNMFWTYSEANSKKNWNIDVQYNGKRYDYMDAWETSNGKQGEVKYNYQWACDYDGQMDCADFFWKYTWEINASNAYVFNYIVESTETSVENSMKYEVVVNEDGSGNIKLYDEGTISYSSQWDASGNGSWISYDDGIQQGTGKWTVQ